MCCEQLSDTAGGGDLACRFVFRFSFFFVYFVIYSFAFSGARSMDKHFLHAPFERNIPVLMGLLGVWNISFMGYKTRTILPYAEALLKFPAHIQQVCQTLLLLLLLLAVGFHLTVFEHQVA